MAERTRTLLLAVASRNGFLLDCPSVTPDPTGILSPHYTDPPDQATPSFLVHHTGTALIQLAVPRSHLQPHDATPTSSSIHNRSSSSSSSTTAWRDSHSLHPQGASTSTPLQRSPAKPSRHRDTVDSSSSGGNDTLSDVETTLSESAGGEDDNGSGFYWHRNTLLPKQKNVPAGLVGRYDEVLERLTADCRNQDRVLETLCKDLFIRVK